MGGGAMAWLVCLALGWFYGLGVVCGDRCHG